MDSRLELLKAEVERVGMQAVAARLGYSRTTVSLVARGKYPGDPERCLARVMEVFGRVQCPYLGEELSGPTCRTYATRSAPTYNPMQLQHWKACQQCPHHPVNQDSKGR